jgi:SHOCT-like protein
MSAEERRKILQMVAEGKISAEQAASLMKALDEDPTPGEIEVVEAGPAAGFAGTETSAPEFEEVKARARNFAMIPLWTGVLIAVLSAWGIYGIQQNAGMNFWFYCLLFPLFLGVLLIIIGAGGQSSRWLYVNVDRRYAEDGPRNITLGFPLPLGLTSWFLRVFGHNIQGLKHTNVDDIIQILDTTKKSGEPFIVNVHDDEDGEHVQVYIG